MTMPTLSEQKYALLLEALKQQEQLRVCPELPPDCLDFSHNDYLGLSTHPDLMQASIEATLQYGTGSRASRLISGTLPIHKQLETAVAEWKQSEAALVFNSGYQANITMLQALVGSEDWVVFDRLNHASLIDGVMLSKCQWKRYHHNDMVHLETQLKAIRSKAPTATLWIVADSVFSMDGDLAPLPEIVQLAKQYNALTYVDEAHGSGIFGDKRSGWAEACGVSQEITLQMGTFSKALGGFGAYAAGSSVLVNYLVNKARGFIYSTALPPGGIATNLAACQLVQQDAGYTQKLWENIRLVESWLPNSGLEALVPDTFQSPIIPVTLGESHRVIQVRNALLQQGFFVQAIRHPTVPKGSERLRLTISAKHSRNELEALWKTLTETIKTVY